MILLKLILFLAILASFTSAQDCSADNIQQSHITGYGEHFLLLQEEAPTMKLSVTNIYMEQDDEYQVKHVTLKDSIANTKFRIFPLTKDMVAIVRCKELNGMVTCGAFPIVFETLQKKGKDYNTKSWNYVEFYTGDSVDEIDKFIFDKKNDKEYTIYVNYFTKKKVTVLDAKSNDDYKKFQIDNDPVGTTDWLRIASCFDKGYKCFVDHSPYYHTVKDRNIYPLRRIEDDDETLFIFHRVRFLKTRDGFYYDTFDNKIICYASGERGEVVIPHLVGIDFKEITLMNFYESMQRQFQNEFTRTCPAPDDIETVKNEKMTRREEEYDDEGQVIPYSGYKAKCNEKKMMLLYVLIAACAFAFVVTVLLFGACVVVCIAKKRMRAMGKRMPKKPWETEMTGDATTFMDQTMGVSTQTTMGGDTSAYTTVAA